MQNFQSVDFSITSVNMTHQCSICGKKYEYKHTLARHMKTKHKGVLPVDPTTVKPSHAWVKDATALISYTCLKCGRMFPSQQFLDIHIKEKGHKQEYLLECFVCKKLFVTQDELNAHVSQEHPPPPYAAQQLPGTVSENTICKQLKFEHPFSMIVAGPSRSGKTQWVIDLLIHTNTRTCFFIYKQVPTGKQARQFYCLFAYMLTILLFYGHL